METEIDLRPYIGLLARQWVWIIGACAVAVIGALVFSLLLPKTYQAQATVAIVRSRKDVSFDPKIQTLSENQLIPVNQDARRSALLGLATSNDIAVQVLEEIGVSLDEDEQNVSSLLDMASATNEGDLIYVTISHNDPAIATQIANVWAQKYESVVNDIYGNNSNVASLDGIIAQLVTADEAYQTAQTMLEAFLADNHIDALQREIDTKENLVGAYQAARIAIQSQPINLQVNGRQQLLTDYYTYLEEVELWLNDARALRDMFKTGPGSAAARLANVLSLVSLQTRVFGGVIPIQLQVDINTDTPNVQISDINTLINVLETQQMTVQTQIDAVSAMLTTTNVTELMIAEDHPINQRIAALNQDILVLQSAQEAENAHRRELIADRDMAWETYQTLLHERQEVEIASQTIGTEVRITSSAVLPIKPVAPHILMNIAIAGLFGFTMSVFTILITTWWRQSL